MSKIMEYYRDLVNIKYITRCYVPEDVYSPIDYLVSMIIEEIQEMKEERGCIYDFAFLELSDLMGVYALLCASTKSSIRKPTPYMYSDDAERRLIVSCTHYLRKRQDSDLGVLIDELHDYIGQELYLISCKFEYDFYKLAYTLISINGLKMITRDRLYNHVIYQKFHYYELSMILKEFFDSRLKEMKHREYILNMHLEMNKLLKGDKAW